MDLLHQWQREAPLAQRLTNGAPEGSARALLLVPRLPVLALTLDAAIPWALACSASQAARRGETAMHKRSSEFFERVCPPMIHCFPPNCCCRN